MSDCDGRCSTIFNYLSARWLFSIVGLPQVQVVPKSTISCFTREVAVDGMGQLMPLARVTAIADVDCNGLSFHGIPSQRRTDFMRGLHGRTIFYSVYYVPMWNKWGQEVGLTEPRQFVLESARARLEAARFEPEIWSTFGLCSVFITHPCFCLQCPTMCGASLALRYRSVNANDAKMPQIMVLVYII